MASDTVEIERFHLRIPGLTRDEAQGVGREAMQRVADSLPKNGKQQNLGSLDLRVNVPVGTPRDQLAKMIALSILERLG